MGLDVANFLDADAIMKIINGNYQTLKDSVAQSNTVIRETTPDENDHAGEVAPEHSEQAPEAADRPR